MSGQAAVPPVARTALGRCQWHRPNHRLSSGLHRELDSSPSPVRDASVQFVTAERQRSDRGW
jgi:hypothetical protein